MKVVYLFNKVATAMVSAAQKGGRANQLYGMVELEKKGHKVSVLEMEMFLPLWLCRFLRKYIFTMHFAHLPIAPLLFRYDVVVSSTAYSTLFLKACLNWIGIRPYTWIVLDFNITGTLKDLRTLKQKIFYFALRRGADAIVAISKAEQIALQKMFPNLKEKIFFCHEATDVNFFSGGEMSPRVQNQFSVISVGNYGRDFKPLIEIARRKEASVIIAAKSSLINGVEKMETLQYGQYSADEMKALYRQVDCVHVAPDIQGELDSVGTLALGEAMAMGKPVIAFRTKNFESYITDYRQDPEHGNGLLIDKDVESLSRAIAYLKNNPDVRVILSKRARQFAQENLSQEHFAEMLDKVIRSC